MKTVAGIFASRAEAARAAESLRALGIPEDRLSLLTQGDSAEELGEQVPTTETEQPGLGKAIGTWAGGALGVAGGLHLGTVIATSLIPGVGPVLAVGMIGAALLGAGGAVAGSKAGEALEDNLAPELPHDELYVYEDALRQGKSVVIAAAEDEAQADGARGALAGAGAESIDAARESWWLGLRDAEEVEYTGQGGDFKSDEADFRRGFEAAQHPRSRGRSFDDDAERLRECYGGACELPSFRRGYERGQTYRRVLGGDAESRGPAGGGEG
jgi:hypothetical protein